MGSIELIDYYSPTEVKLMTAQKIDGKYKQLLYSNMLSQMEKEKVDAIFSNSYKALNFFANPNYDDEDNNLSKILCLGKVQSGKTAFFISSLSLAFDNGYNIAYVLGGTKNTLRDQNLDRISAEFNNNEDVVVYDLNEFEIENVDDALKKGKKVILVVLKNPSENTNLGQLESVISYFGNQPSVIVDDEGDEYTPGAPKLKKKNIRAGKTHDVISDILSKIKCCTYLSVTATPQANLLLSTIDELSPDYAVLVEPGKGYTGGNAFHDTMNNPHVIEISDHDDFETSIPDTFKKCIYFFILSCCIKRMQGINEPYSMLVHPSSLTKVHTMIESKINDYILNIKSILLDTSSVPYLDALDKLSDAYDEYVEVTPENNLDFQEIVEQIPDVLTNISSYEFNVSKTGRMGIKTAKDDDSLYKIYVGGNMLGRGLTIKNLIVTYIYRDSKETAIDTLYQRARWFGYKANYFDVCRVYMTKQLKEKFVATVENENDMWNTMNSFLLSNINIKYFPRLFTLNNDKLILTRKTVAKTITVQRINPGYSYDKSIWFEDMVNDRIYNRNLYENFIQSWAQYGYEKSFSTNQSQVHLIIKMKYSDFYRDFLSKYKYQENSKYGIKSFENIIHNIEQNCFEDEVHVVVMRYKCKQKRSIDKSGYSIRELPQSYNEGTQYSGDKLLDGLHDKFHIQLHLVYHDDYSKKDYLPMIAMNNPITKYNVRYVTGDNEYETI